MQLLRRLLLYNLLVIIIIVQCPNPKGEPEFSAIKLEFLSPIPRHPWDGIWSQRSCSVLSLLMCFFNAHPRSSDGMAGDATETVFYSLGRLPWPYNNNSSVADWTGIEFILAHCSRTFYHLSPAPPASPPQLPDGHKSSKNISPFVCLSNDCADWRLLYETNKRPVSWETVQGCSTGRRWKETHPVMDRAATSPRLEIASWAWFTPSVSHRFNIYL